MDPAFELPIFICEDARARDGQLEPSRPTRARIEIEHSFVAANLRLMRVAIEHSGEACRGWIQVQLMNVVKQVEIET